MTTAANVRIGVTGAVYGAPTGTTLPTTANASLNGAFVDLGYVTEDGITESHAEEINEIKAWQNGDVVRKVKTSDDVTYQLAFLEMSAEVLETFYGADSYEPGVVHVTGAQGVRQSWVFDVIDGDERFRIVIPDGQITERGDVQYVNEDAISYEVTITAYPDGDGDKARIYLGTGFDGS